MILLSHLLIVLFLPSWQYIFYEKMKYDYQITAWHSFEENWFIPLHLGAKTSLNNQATVIKRQSNELHST